MSTPTKLRKTYPDRCVTKSTLWTPRGNCIQTVASHEPDLGLLLASLLVMTGPRNDAERDAMTALREAIRKTNDSPKG